MPLRPRGRSSRQRSAVTRERGSATVVSVAVMCVVLVVGLALAALGGHLRDRATSRAGADLAALAGASAVRARLDGAGAEPCEAGPGGPAGLGLREPSRRRTFPESQGN